MDDKDIMEHITEVESLILGILSEIIYVVPRSEYLEALLYLYHHEYALCIDEIIGLIKGNQVSITSDQYERIVRAGKLVLEDESNLETIRKFVK